MKARSIIILFFLVWAGSVQALRAQASAPGVPVLTDGTAASAPVSVPHEAQTSVPAAEEISFERDPFLSWLPSKMVPVEPVVSGEALGGGVTKEDAFDPGVYKVKGIVWGVEKARAIMNGKIVGVGDIVLDAEILRIDKEGILLRFHEKEYLLARAIIDGNDSKEGKQ